MKSLKELVRTFNSNTQIIEELSQNMEKALLKILEKLEVLSDNISIVDQDKDVVTNVIQDVSAVSQQSSASTEEVSSSLE